MPYFSATYASSVAKIFATMGPYIVKCSATTGELETVTRLGAPIYGDMPICYHSGTGFLFVGSGVMPNKQSFNSYNLDPPLLKDIYKVNPTTMAVTACGINAFLIPPFSTPFKPTEGGRGGPYHIVEDGDYILFQFRFGEKTATWGRMHATSLACNGDWVWKLAWEQIAVDPVYVNTLDPYQRQVQVYDKTLSTPAIHTSVDIIPYTPVGMCYSLADNKLWVVCGNEFLLRVNSHTDLDYDVYDLTAVSGPTVTPDPCRIQYLSDGMLYLPCTGPDGIIVFDPLVGTGTWKGGFEGPIDVVEAGAKKFAVQSGPVGLKEIT